MKTLLKKLILSFVLIFATSMNIGAKVVSYPVPQTEPLSSDYTVEVNGITIPVYTADTNTTTRNIQLLTSIFRVR
ncbi:hypothetical protein NXX09_08830 [Bacteroides uniformis]|nr:hypothetical protein [Bacteroides uniformis]